MADNSVFITGAANGAFTEALSDLPPWATEHTAGQIEKHLRKNLSIQTQALRDLVRAAKGRSGTSNPNTENKKLSTELEKLLKNLVDQNKEANKKKKQDKEREVADKKSLLGVKEFDNKWQKARFVLNSIANVGEKLIKVDQQYMKTSDELYKSGINLLNGNDDAQTSMMSLNQAVALTGIRLETLQEVAEKYSNSINAVGFTKFAKATYQATLQLKDFGYSSKQVAELIGVYTDSMQGFTDMRQRSEQELADDAIRLGTQMGKLSLQVGISQKQLEANMVANSKSTNATLIFAAKGELAAKNMELFTSTFKDQNVGKFFEAMSAASDPVYTAGFQALQKAGLGDIANNLAQIGKSAEILGPEAARKQLNEYSKTIDPARFRGLQDQLANHSEGAQEAADMLAGVTREARNTTNATIDQSKKAVESESVLTKWNTEVERSKAIMQAAFPPLESQITALTKSLGLLNDAVYGVINHTNTEARSWISAGTVVAGFIAGTLLPLIGKAGTWLNVFGKSAGTAAEATLDAAKASSKATAVTSGAAAEGGLLSRLLGLAKIGGVGASLALHSGELNTNEDNELAKRRTKGATIDQKNIEISIPKAPAPSTISSPSAVPATPQSTPSDTGVKSSPANAPAGPGIDKAPAGIDINSTLTYQSNLLAEILEGTKSLVSVNKDILRYTRNQT